MDSKYKNILYIAGGAAVLYFVFRSKGSDSDAAKPPAGIDYKSIFETGVKSGGRQAMQIDSRNPTPVVTPTGKILIMPAPATAAGTMPKEKALALQRHLNWFFSRLKMQQDMDENFSFKPVKENGQAGIDTLKAFWLWFNIAWCASNMVGDYALAGQAPVEAACLATKTRRLIEATTFREDLTKKAPFNYVPPSSVLGKGQPSDYSIYVLFDLQDPNLTAAFSEKAIEWMAAKAGVVPTERDWRLLKRGLDQYLSNKSYKASGDFITDRPFPSPYPSSWPT